MVLTDELNQDETNNISDDTNSDEQNSRNGVDIKEGDQSGDDFSCSKGDLIYFHGDSDFIDDGIGSQDEVGFTESDESDYQSYVSKRRVSD